MEAPKLEVGNFLVTATEQKGHSADFWAKSASDRIISVGNKSHPLIAQQAEAFKESVEQIVLFYLKATSYLFRSSSLMKQVYIYNAVRTCKFGLA